MFDVMETARELGGKLRGASADDRSDDRPSTERLLTDREQVLRVLETSGGRIWQSSIADETGWSKSKVSRVLSDMESSGTIRRYRVKRRNVVCLPEAAPERLQSD